MEIRRYTPADEAALFRLLEAEGEDWSDYYGPAGRERYARALADSVTYLAWVDGALRGYARCREDGGFGVYVYDLLVHRDSRGQGLGAKLMEQACLDFPGETVYVMSDVDAYYAKLGYQREGSIFVVTRPS